MRPRGLTSDAGRSVLRQLAERTAQGGSRNADAQPGGFAVAEFGVEPEQDRFDGDLSLAQVVRRLRGRKLLDDVDRDAVGERAFGELGDRGRLQRQVGLSELALLLALDHLVALRPTVLGEALGEGLDSACRLTAVVLPLLRLLGAANGVVVDLGALLGSSGAALALAGDLGGDGVRHSVVLPL